VNAGFFLPSNNKVALIQGLAGVECAAVACAFVVWGGAGNGEGSFVHRGTSGTSVGNFIALSGEYKIFAGMDCLP
jgi:hypothetical protein